MTESNFHYYPCEGEALDLLRAYRDEMDAMINDHSVLQEDFNARAKAQADAHKANLREMWRRLSAMVGLDPDQTWGNPDFQIEARYVDDGFGAITFEPSVHPLSGMTPGVQTGSLGDPAMEEAPDKSKLN